MRDDRDEESDCSALNLDAAEVEEMRKGSTADGIWILMMHWGSKEFTLCGHAFPLD
jgi:hypothetical protein